MHHLGQETGRGVLRAKRHDAAGRAAGLLLQLPRAARGEVLRPVVELAGRYLQQLGIIRIAELPHQNDVARPIDRQHAHAADMLAHLAPRPPAVWQQDLVQPRFHDLPFKKILVGKLFLSHIHLLCSLSHGVPKQRRI